MNNKVVASLCCGLLIACLSIAIYLSWQPQHIPQISMQMIDGKKVSIETFKGKALLVNFWATTCIECVSKTPELISLYQEFADDSFEIIAIAMPYDPPNRVIPHNWF